MLPIHLRPAIEEDAAMILEWRNAPETRRYSFETRVIDTDEHIKWFKKTIALKNRCLLVAELDKQPIGVMRFDEADNMTVEVSIYLSPATIGKGLGAVLLHHGAEWIEHNMPNIKKLRAKVIPENTASVRVFEKAGYSKAYAVYEKMINE